MNKEGMSLLYIWDAYCGWCYGFSRSLGEFHAKHPELPLTVLSGGLFAGERKLPIDSFPHIPEANKRISQLTGAEFGESYQTLLEEGGILLDSEAAAEGFAALRHFAPARAYHLAASMQHKFYYEGKSLRDPETYREIAVENRLDPDAVEARFESVDSTADARADFAKVQQLDIHSYPTLLLKKGDEVIGLGGGVMTAEKIEARLEQILS